jgi:hypothetical protein
MVFPETRPLISSPNENIRASTAGATVTDTSREMSGGQGYVRQSLTRADVYGADDTDFSVRFGSHVIPYEVFGVYVSPGETVEVAAVLSRIEGPYTLEASAGSVATVRPGQWRWTAPDRVGAHSLEILQEASTTSVTLNVFVQQPFNVKRRRVNGYHIGKYEEEALRGRSSYEPPVGLIEVDHEIRQIKVSPHFTVGEFLAKQNSDYPKYLLLREALLLKLEMMIGELRRTGVESSRLHIMSGYRTPYYNRSIGNRTKYSRHLYGGAADVFVDGDFDGYMDDITGDGHADIEDARALADIIRTNEDKDWYAPFVGGLGVYPANDVHGPFIHVDVRGYRARW